MIIENDRVKLTDAQRTKLLEFDSYSENDDKVEYSYTDELNDHVGVPGELFIMLDRGIEWDNERVTYLMDTEGALEIL